MTKMSDEELSGWLGLVASHGRAIETHERDAEKILKACRPHIIGRRIKVDLMGRLKGVYEIRDVRLSSAFPGRLDVRGLKVVSGGKLGSQLWDLGPITRENLGL